MTDQYVHRYHDTNFSESLPPLEDFARCKTGGLEWYEHNYASLLPNDHTAKVLDVGCGMGEFLYFLKQRGFNDLEGVDIAQHLLDYCRGLVGCTTTRVRDIQEFLESRPESYDLIYLGDVIEHFSKQELFPILDRVRSALKSGGCLLIRTNNAAGISGTYQRYTSLTHELCFNDLSLRKVLEADGFARVRVFPERLPFRWRFRRIAWLLLRKVWFACLNAIYYIETGSNRPQILTRVLLAQAFKE